MEYVTVYNSYQNLLRKSENNKKKENLEELNYLKKNQFLLKIFDKKITNVWMSHQDAVINLPKGLIKLHLQKNSALTIIENKNLNIYGINFIQK